MERGSARFRAQWLMTPADNNLDAPARDDATLHKTHNIDGSLPIEDGNCEMRL